MANGNSSLHLAVNPSANAYGANSTNHEKKQEDCHATHNQQNQLMNYNYQNDQIRPPDKTHFGQGAAANHGGNINAGRFEGMNSTGRDLGYG